MSHKIDCSQILDPFSVTEPAVGGNFLSRITNAIWFPLANSLPPTLPQRKKGGGAFQWPRLKVKRQRQLFEMFSAPTVF